MKTVLLLLGVLVVLVCVSVDARRRTRGSDDDSDDVDIGQRGDRKDWRDRRYRYNRREEIYTEDGLGRDDGHRGGRWGGHRGGPEGGNWRDRVYGGNRGGHHHRGRYDKFWRNCTCRSQCEGNTGEKLIGCHTNRTAYIHCQDTTCAVELCPADKLFNATSRTCESCPAGFHVDAQKRHCVCDEGSTFDFRSRTCIPCPTGSVVSTDKCYCENSVLDKKANACRDCPEGTTKGRHGCECNNRQEFWSWDSFSCVACPGEWVRRSEGSSRRRQRPVDVCECQGEKEIFNRWSVTCIRCPDNSIVATKYGKSYCDCTEIGQRYDWKTNTCVNRSADDPNDEDDDDATPELAAEN